MTNLNQLIRKTFCSTLCISFLSCCLGVTKDGFALSYESPITTNSLNGVEKVFSDVTIDFWGIEYISSMLEMGIVSGYEDGTFRPGSTITVAEFTTMLVKMQNYDLVKVENGQWYESFIRTAENEGLIMKGEYSPEQLAENISRADMARMIARAGSLEMGIGSYFKDHMDIKEPYLPYIYSVANAEIIKGYEDGSFAPAREATRAEASVMLKKLMDYQKKNEEETPVVVVPDSEENPSFDVWSDSEFDEFMSNFSNYKSIQSGILYKNGKLTYSNDVDIARKFADGEVIAEKIDELVKNLLWMAKKNGDYLVVDPRQDEVSIYYSYNSYGIDHRSFIFRIDFDQSGKAWNIDGWDPQYSFLIKNMVDFKDLGDRGLSDDELIAFMEENKGIDPKYYEVVRLAMQTLYGQSQGDIHAKLLVDDFTLAKYGKLTNKKEERVINSVKHIRWTDQVNNESNFFFVGLHSDLPELINQWRKYL